MSVEIVSATRATGAQLWAGTGAAFSDYAVPMQMSQAAFDFMMRQRGLVREVSVVALAEGEVVGAWLVSIAGKAAYLISSGTRPAYRGQGIARRMAVRCLDGLRERGVETFQTEVMDGNDPAAALYQSLGMGLARKVTCYDGLKAPASPAVQTELQDWGDIVAEAPACRDWAPTWQNSDDALTRVAEDLRCVTVRDGAGLAGYGAFIVSTNVLAQIAVRPDCRRQGVAGALVARLGEWGPEGGLRVLNAQASDAGFQQFMQALGARRTVEQSELISHL